MRRLLHFTMYAIACILTLLFPGAIAAQSGRVFYIDYGSGSNSNSGTSTAAPWKSHPYMNHSMACDGGSSPSYTHQSGDKFLFKGGVTWPAPCFQITLLAGGTSSAQDYYGVCLATDPDSPCYPTVSWPASAWTRPFWGGSNAYIGSGNHFIYANGANDFTAPGFGYVTIDNIEIGNWNAQPGSAGSSNVFSGPAIALGGADNFAMMTGSVVENMYIHDWVSDTPMVTCTPYPGCSPRVLAYGQVYGAALMNNSTISDQNGHYYVQSPVGGANHLINMPSMGGCAGCGEVKNSVVKYAWMGCSSCFSVHDSDFSFVEEEGTYTYSNPPVGVQIHSHIIYDDGGNQQTVYVYNNAIHDSNAGLNMYLYYTAKVFNNAMWNLGNNAAIDLTNCLIIGQCSADKATNVGWEANNTIDMASGGGTGLGCYRWDPNAPSQGLGTLNFYNHICIPNGSGTGSFSVATINGAATNYSMGTSEATTYGFVAANKYKPTLSDPNTAGRGANLTSTCAAVSPASCSDASGAPWFGGAPILRPSAPDTGAYQGITGASNPPAVSISISPSTQPVSGSIFATSTCTPKSPATISSQTFKIDGFPFGATGTTSPFSVIFNSTTAANGSHIITSTCTDSNSQQASASITVTVSNSMPGCFVSGVFTSYISFAAQTGLFNFTIGPITPWTNNQDTVIAFSQSPMTAYGQGAALFRFNSSGNIDAWSGVLGNYTAANTAPYSAGGNYFLSGAINVPAGTYSLSETSPSNIVIIPAGTPYTFRTTAPAASLGYLNAISDNSTPDTAKVCNLSIGGTPGGLSIAPTSLNFGSVPLTSVSNPQTAAGTVTGNPVTIASAAISGANAADFAIGASTCTGTVGASCIIPVTFTPSITGAESAILTVTSNASNSPQTVALSGTGVPQASVSPTSLSFGTVKTTQSVTLQSTLTNNGAGTLSSIVPSYSGNSQFALAAATGTDCQTVGSLASGANCNIALTFTPTAASSYTGTISIASSMTGSPITIAATGTGVAASPGLSLSPTSLAFGSAPVSSISSQTVMGTTSGGSVTFSSVAVSGANAADFVIGANTCTGTVPTSCAIPITFTPSIVGAESATLTVTSNAAGSPQTVALTGTGRPQGAVNPTSQSFGNVFVGNSASLESTFTNSGGAALTSVAVSVSGSGFSLITPSTGTDCRSSASLQPGATCRIAVQFAPGSATSFSGSVSVASSMIGSPLAISLSGTGVSPPTPVLTFNLSEIDFGAFALTGGSLPIGVIGTPSGGNVTFTGNPALGGANAADFALPTNSCVGTISVPCTTTVQFTPSIVGQETATLTYTDNATGSPQTIVLTGSGVSQAVVFPGSLIFGNVRIGSISQQAVTLRNNGAAPLSSIVVSYSGASQFTLSPPSGADCRSITSLPAGSSCTVAVQFLPTTNTDFTGTISIASSMLGSPLQVAVTGTGKKGGRPSGGKNFVDLILRMIEAKGG